MIANIIWMAISTGARLGGGFLTFVVIARVLGPDEFGRYMYWFAATYLASLLANLGFSNLLLREIGRDAAKLIPMTAAALSARLIATGVIGFLAALIAPAIGSPVLMPALLAAHLMECLAETCFVALRASSRFAVETAVATASTILQLALLSGAALYFREAESIAVAYAIGRFIQLCIVATRARFLLGITRLASIQRAIALVRTSRSYAVDFVLGNLFGHIDSLLLKVYVGVGGVGLFQAGMRVFQGAAQLAPVLANVFLPATARAAARDSSEYEKAGSRVQVVFVLSGTTIGLMFAYGADPIVRVLFGDEFESLAALLPLFGVLFFVRFFAAAWGLLLTAQGMQTYRAVCTAVHLLAALLFGMWWMPSAGVSGWLGALIAANALLAALYVFGALRFGPRKASPLVMLVTILGGLPFFPLISAMFLGI